MVNALLDDPLFAGSAPASTLRAMPLGFIDVGARGDIHEVVKPLAGVTAVLGFEPDPEECRRIRDNQAGHPWAQFELEPSAVAGDDSERPFYVTARPVNSSLLRPSAAMARRYDIPGFEVARQVSLRTRPLDAILFDDRAAERHWGEFLKLDAQGADLDILKGAGRMLTERTVAAIVEVELCPLYEEQPLFAEVEQHLRQFKLAFYGFNAMSYRSARLRHLRGREGPRCRERLLHADAIFFKDPLAPNSAVLSERAAHVLFTCAMLLGYHDFALEVALGTWARGDEAARLQALVERQAQAPE